MIRTTVRGPYTARQILDRPKLYRRLMRLTNGGDGRGASTLYPVLSHLRRGSKDKFWLAWHEGEVIAWLWVEKPSRRTFFAWNGIQKLKVSTIGTFVHHKYRRKGIGKKLLNRVDRDISKSIYFVEEAWNNAGHKLYEAISHRTEWAYAPGVRRY